MRRSRLILTTAFLLCILHACTDDDETRNTNTKPVTVVVEREDAEFVIMANNVIKTEIEAGKLAMKKGSDKRIRNFGMMMVKDYSKGSDKLNKLATSKKITLPDTLAASTQSGLNKLGENVGKTFDKAYISYMNIEHKNAIYLFQDASRHRFDQDIKSFAGKGSLAFKRHLEAIDAISASMK